ncbi:MULTISPECIES: DHA2 family efflux MFS transporter permease subunit [Bacillus cereus group]|uniref:DHA2 family efflux MFS transporter permease subunit n=1 Tax=Bacillus cereus group TaxID=86661 RepID=UPI000872C988|nr:MULTISPECIES: DHA2 family efflux MFS transporter permease subunit [Bacillus cereus group]OFC97594.1 multidrug resistance protein B [Bacillus thuringiensis]MBJ8049562.1 DHA2 family efflux MFS transporter permease subunit [Bacillus cereus group sp. N18]PDY49543.1 MFS transporter [Bacillus toyonensis]PED62780.1 MFS transporter [Bacillus toyonensis]PFY77567.1 MFS transporter [Bacillus toyonensis]
MNKQKSTTDSFIPIIIPIFLGSFLSILNMSTINVAIPEIMRYFQTDLDSVQWTITGFILATGIIAPITGSLGDRYSYKYLYFFSLLGFTLFSALCAFSWSISSLIGFRILQGAFCGLIMPTTMAIIFQVIAKEKQALAMSIWSISATLAPALGPTLSGWLIQTLGWKWIFLINVPIGIIAMILTMLLIPYYRLQTPKSFDFIGFITVILSSFMLIVAFSQGHQWGWTSWEIISLLVLGIIILGLFIWWELKHLSPLLNIRVFQNTRFTISIIISSILTISLYSGTYLMPLFLQNVQHVSALDTGLILLPSSIAMVIAMIVAGKLYHRIGAFALIVTGITLLIIGTLGLSFLQVDTSTSYIIFWMTIRNIGVAFSTMPASNTGMEEVPLNLSGHASSINNWTRQSFGSLAIGLFTSILATRMIVHTEKLSGSAISIQQQAFTLSIHDVFIIATVIAMLGLPFSFYLKAKKTNCNNIGG